MAQLQKRINKRKTKPKKPSPSSRSSSLPPSNAQGRQGHFQGVKLDFLRAQKERYLTATNISEFYDQVTDEFIERFGNVLPFGQNPPDDAVPGSLAPRPIPDDASNEERTKEANRRTEYKKNLRRVSISCYLQRLGTHSIA
jgi:hypothetical protein